MEPTKFDFSLKCISFGKKKEFIKKKLIARAEQFIKNLRWRVFHYKNRDKPKGDVAVNSYGFKSNRSPPMDED